MSSLKCSWIFDKLHNGELVLELLYSNHRMQHKIIRRNETHRHGNRDCIIFPKIYVQSITKVTKQKKLKEVYVTRNRLGKWPYSFSAGENTFLTNEYSPFSCHRKINNKIDKSVSTVHFQPKEKSVKQTNKKIILKWKPTLFGPTWEIMYNWNSEGNNNQLRVR